MDLMISLSKNSRVLLIFNKPKRIETIQFSKTGKNRPDNKTVKTILLHKKLEFHLLISITLEWKWLKKDPKINS